MASFSRHEPIQARTAGGDVRHWMTSTCPNCAGPVVIEYAASHGDDRVMTVVPEDVDSVQIAHLPERVKKHFSAAEEMIRVQAPDMAAVAMRRTLEAACNASGADGRSLFERIRQLQEGGQITPDFSKAAHHVRRIGNIGAHDTDEDVDLGEAKLMFRFVTQLLRNLFEIPGELAALESDGSSSETVETT